MIAGSSGGCTPPTVSVLMAVYNGQSYVRQAVDGILAQTFQDFEFVIVDDGSTDGTPQILDEYVDSRIVRLKHTKNRGLIAALNTGLAAAQGELVARQDVDDLSYPERLQIEVDFLRSRPDVALVGSASDFEALPGGPRMRRTVERDPLRLAWILLFYCPLAHPSVLFRRKVIQDLGGYREGDVLVEDFALWARVTRSSRVANVGHVLVIRRRPPESITARHGSEMGRAARRISLQNLQWVSGSSVSAAQLDALQAFFGNRPLSLSDALSLETRGLRAAAVHVFEDFWGKVGAAPAALPEFRKWAFRWMGVALLRRSRKLLTRSASHSGRERALGLRLARALALNAIKMSPALILSRRGVAVAIRAIMRAPEVSFRRDVLPSGALRAPRRDAALFGEGADAIAANEAPRTARTRSEGPSTAGSGRDVVLVVSIDTECDKGPGWKTQHPLRFRSVTEGIPGALEPLFRKHGIVPTYLLSPEILRDPQSVAVLRGLTRCELGTHLHGEFIEPEACPDARVTSTPQNSYSPAVEREKLRNLTALFRERLGYAPISFRGGRFALSTHTLGFLEELGYRVDSTVTPFRTNEFEGGIRCNYWGAPLNPYHPSRRDPRRSGSLRLLEVPVTILAPSLARLPGFLLRRLSDRTVKSRFARAVLGAAGETIWVRPLRGTAEQLASWADTVVEGWTPRSPAVLNVMFHSVEVIPDGSPYTRTEEDVERFLESLGQLFGHLRGKYRVVSTGLAGVAESWAS